MAKKDDNFIVSEVLIKWNNFTVSTKGVIRHRWRSDTTTKTLRHKNLLHTATMTCPIKSDAQKKKGRLQLALTAFSNGQKTASEAIRDYNIARKTFYQQLSGVPPRNLAHEKDQFLTSAEEQVLVKWIT